MDINNIQNQEAEIKLPPKWTISNNQLIKFYSLNPSLPPNSFNNQKKSIIIPTETPINFSPLFPFINIKKPLHFNPLHKIEKNNRELYLIETKGSEILWVKDMAFVPSNQNNAFCTQLRNWRLKVNLGESLSEQALFRLGEFLYHPDAVFLSNYTCNLLNQNIKEKHISTFPPEFVIEVRSYNTNSPNNALEHQMDKMVNWIESGVESGVLFDGPGRSVYLYCDSSMLHILPPALQSVANLQVTEQITQTNTVVQPPDRPNNVMGLTLEQHKLYHSQYDEFIEHLETANFNHIYFENLNPVPGHPKVSLRQVNFWPEGNQPPQPINGPNSILHCIGAVNGFKIDLSGIPMEYQQYI